MEGERRREGGDGSECDETTSPEHDEGTIPEREEATSPDRDEGNTPERDEATGDVHVRRLGVVDTLRWSWEVLGARRDLVAVAFAVNLPSVVATLGVSRPSPSAMPEFADWVLWLHLVQLLGVFVAGGAFYLTAADAVANRSRPLVRHLVTATKRLPALVGTAVVTGLLVGLSLLPAVAVAVAWPRSAVGQLLSVVLVLPGIYVFHRLLLAYPACVVDRNGPVASARASWLAATGTVWKVFAVGVGYLFATVASNAVAGLFGDVYDLAPTLVSTAFGAVVLPLLGLAVAHLYLEGSRNR